MPIRTDYMAQIDPLPPLDEKIEQAGSDGVLTCEQVVFLLTITTESLPLASNNP